MKQTILSLLLASAAVPAFAADMPIKAPPRPIAAPVSDWTGFYLFGFGGYSWGKGTPDDFNVSDIDDRLHNPKPKGGVFGFGAGYNWQYSRFVGGLEVDYGFSSEKETQSLSDPITDDDRVIGSFNTTLSSKITALGSARARAGFLITDNVLAYGTAGLAWGRAQATFRQELCITSEGCESQSLTSKATLFGWVAGGGVEWQVLQHLRLRGEYLHYDFGSTSFAFQPIITINAKVTDDVVRGALIWSFN